MACMKVKSYALIALAAAQVSAQNTYSLTDCHLHGNVEYCVHPTGGEIPWTTYSSTTATATPETITSAAAAAEATDAPTPTAVTACHAHEDAQYCLYEGTEYAILTTPTGTEALPAQYTGCHSHGSEGTYCVAPDGSEVEIAAEGSEAATGGEESAASGEIDCHFHAGVEHCVGPNGEDVASSCALIERDYDIGLRVGLLFVILITSAIAVFGPVLLVRFTKLSSSSSVLLLLKQFGTGVIISTAIVHLFTHAELQFASDCLGELKYEATTGAILIAGVFVAFLVEYIGMRIINSRRSGREDSHVEHSGGAESPHSDMKGQQPTLMSHAHDYANDKLDLLVMEAGILFHSIIIGLTLVVAGDSFFITLFIVIIFHQMFEGLALGTRIAALDPLRTRLLSKLLMALAFALITPLGMAIGIGVLGNFNGNDPKTIIAIGTLDAFSAGILLWVGLVQMLAKDWLFGELRRGRVVVCVLAGLSFVLGLALMSLLGRWV